MTIDINVDYLGPKVALCHQRGRAVFEEGRRDKQEPDKELIAEEGRLLW
jgi:hypothetical protein